MSSRPLTVSHPRLSPGEHVLEAAHRQPSPPLTWGTCPRGRSLSTIPASHLGNMSSRPLTVSHPRLSPGEHVLEVAHRQPSPPLTWGTCPRGRSPSAIPASHLGNMSSRPLSPGRRWLSPSSSAGLWASRPSARPAPVRSELYCPVTAIPHTHTQHRNTPVSSHIK